jgi:5-methylcytosine-specific restriction endonuclease McrA
VPYTTKDGKRDYKREYAKYHSKPEQRANRSARTLARNAAIAVGTVSRGDGKDLDHKTPLSKGGSNSKSNLRVVSAGQNRSFSRNKDSSIKSQTSKRERKKK